MQKRMHSREFKLDVVRQIASGHKRPAQVCREYGLAESVLSRWRREYQQRGESAFLPPQSEQSSTQEQRIAELERFCGQLALENQVLKKRCRAGDQGAARYDRAGTSAASGTFDRAFVRPVRCQPQLVLRAQWPAGQ